MKIRNFALLLAFISGTTVFMLFFGDSQPTFNRFVAETQTKITQWKNTKELERVKNLLDPAEKYLQKLGFQKNAEVLPTPTPTPTGFPAFLTAVSSSDVDLISHFTTSFRIHFPDDVLIVYTLDLTNYELVKVFTACNLSSCSVYTFDFKSYPSHVRDLKLCAFRPIIIQAVLQKYDAVVFLDVQFTFTSSEIGNVIAKAKKEGIVSWGINHPTSALTHPHMFEYFHTTQDNYYFHRMVQPSHMVLYNTATIHNHLMLPWVTCALVSDCIAPIGSQSSGCRFDKKPLYRYSGCHRYDMSALNVALGVLFDYSASRYVASEEDKFFQHIEVEEKHPRLRLPKDLTKNSTAPYSDSFDVGN